MRRVRTPSSGFASWQPAKSNAFSRPALMLCAKQRMTGTDTLYDSGPSSDHGLFGADTGDLPSWAVSTRGMVTDWPDNYECYIKGSSDFRTRPLSVSFWYRNNDTSSDAWVFNNSITSTSPSFAVKVDINAGQSRLALYAGNYNYSSDAHAADTEWHHWGLAWGADDAVDYYVDGRFISSGTRTQGATAANGWELGKIGPGISGFELNGQLDAFALWEKYLLGPTFADLFKSQINGGPGILGRSFSRHFPAAVAAGGALTGTVETFENASPFGQDESIDTVAVTGGTPPYSYEILKQYQV